MRDAPIDGVEGFTMSFETRTLVIWNKYESYVRNWCVVWRKASSHWWDYSR